MKFKVSQTDFSKALLSVNKSLAPRANLPILANIMLAVGEEGLEVLATDLETATKVRVGCKSEKGGKITVPGRTLSEFVPQLPEGEVFVEKLGEELLVSCGNYSARFATMPTEEFPAIPKIEKGTIIEVEPKELGGGILKVFFCAAQDEGRPVLTGVLCQFDKNSLSIVATDGYRLSFQKIATSGKGATLKVIIPAKALVEVAKIISEQDWGETGEKIQILLAESLNQVNFKIGKVEFTSRLIEGEFPSWQKIIPTNFTSKAKILREEFVKLVRVASIFARDSGNIVRLKLEQESANKNQKGKAMMVISANNNQVGSNEAKVEIDLVGSGGEIAFNWRYLLEMLSSVDDDYVNFEMIESLNPGKLTVGTDDEMYFHIIMPVRLQS